MSKHWISASLLSADWAQLGHSAVQILAAGADRLHIDVMDHHYVPNLTLGSKICADLRAFGIQAPLDVHLMVNPVDALIQEFGERGASSINIHPSTSPHIEKSIALIRSLHCEVGLVLNPNEPLALIQPYLDQIDRVLIMSVYPGFGGQSFIPQVLPKVLACKEYIQRNDLNICLEIDGGINHETIKLAAAAGVQSFVSGSYLFESGNYELKIKALRKEITG